MSLIKNYIDEHYEYLIQKYVPIDDLIKCKHYEKEFNKFKENYDIYERAQIF